MKYIQRFCSVLSVVIAISFVATAAGAHVERNTKKADRRPSIVKKHGTSVKETKKTGSRKKNKLRTVRQASNKSKGKAAYVYTAKKGDTITKVAKRFKKKARDLKEINGLTKNSLKPGQKILLVKRNKVKHKDISEASARKNQKIIATANSSRLEEVKRLIASEDLLAGLSAKERMVLFAKKMLHFPYHFGGNGTIGLDCSAYVQKVFGFIGHRIPRSSREQFNVGEAVDRENLETGDLVFFSNFSALPSHVGIYLGNNLFIHASSASKQVTIDSMGTPYYVRRYLGAKRIVSGDEIAVD